MAFSAFWGEKGDHLFLGAKLTKSARESYCFLTKSFHLRGNFMGQLRMQPKYFVHSQGGIWAVNGICTGRHSTITCGVSRAFMGIFVAGITPKRRGDFWKFLFGGVP